MKAIVCEMCGNNEFVKQDGFMVCQSCGTKYTVEEAKKMMVEGVVKIDDTDELKKLYQAARNARETGDTESALKHYENISAHDPDSWEALFYCVILKTNTVKNGQIGAAALSVSNCLEKVLRLINDNIADDNEKKQAVKQVYDECLSTAQWLTTASHNFCDSLTKGSGAMMLTGISGAVSSLNSVGSAIGEDRSRCLNIANIMCCFGNNIEQIFGMNDKFYSDLAVLSWKKLIEFDQGFRAKHGSNMMDNDSIDRFSQKIHRYEPNYDLSSVKKENIAANNFMTGFLVVVGIIGAAVWIFVKYLM